MTSYLPQLILGRHTPNWPFPAIKFQEFVRYQGEGKKKKKKTGEDKKPQKREEILRENQSNKKKRRKDKKNKKKDIVKKEIKHCLERTTRICSNQEKTGKN
jgi:hypothetical protein